MTSTLQFSENPYPGLRPFEVEESDIFFGRERQTDRILERLQRHRFIAVVGPSGCGKSSLVRAGMIAGLRTGFAVEAGSKWAIACMRPGNAPLSRLAQSLLETKGLGAARADDRDANLYLEQALRTGPLSLIEFLAESAIAPGTNLLVLVDQFEELFRFHDKNDPDEAEAFVSLLLTSAAQRRVPIYIVITMRSDFFGEAALFHGLPEAINDSQFLTPRLSREECASAIAGPARVFGGDVSPALVNRLLNDFGPDPDQLPLLQHTLMRMWRRAVGAGPAHSKVCLDVDAYNEQGGLEQAISQHADEAFLELQPAQQQLTHKLFARLTERASGKRDTRAPARISQIAAIARTPVEDVVAVAEAFRRPDRCFLTPRVGPLEPNTILDITHESLIRQWKRLSLWADQEAQTASTYTRLVQTARLHQCGQAALWHDEDLAPALRWRDELQPNRDWAARYGAPEDFDLATEFLRTSEAAWRSEQQRLEEVRMRKLSRARKATLALGLALVSLIASVVLHRYLFVWEHVADFAVLVRTQWGPRGQQPLDKRAQENRPTRFRLVTQGRWGHVLRISSLDGLGHLTNAHNEGTYLDYGDDIRLRPAQWGYSYDDHGNLATETAIDKQGKPMWAFVYGAFDSDRSRTGLYVAADGFANLDTRHARTFVRITYSSRGLEELITYRNASGAATTGLDKAYGRRYRYDAQDRVTDVISIGPPPQNLPMNDEFGNAVERFTQFDSAGRVLEAIALDASGQPVQTKNGWAKVRLTYDPFGNRLRIAFFDVAGAPTTCRDGFHAQESTFVLGKMTELRLIGTDGKAAMDPLGCAGYKYEHDSRNRIVRTVCLGSDGNPAEANEGYQSLRTAYNDRDEVVRVEYFDGNERLTITKNGYARREITFTDQGPNRRIVQQAYSDSDGHPMRIKEGYARQTETLERGRSVRTEYFDVDGRPISSAKGYAVVTREYDGGGNQKKARYLDAKGAVTLSSEGYAAWSSRWDVDGNHTDESLFDEKDKAVVGKEGWARLHHDYDLFGHQTKSSYFGVDGMPVATKDGISVTVRHFDDFGRQDRECYLGVDGSPTRSDDGYSCMTFQFDSNGRKVRTNYDDGKGNPVASKDGSAAWTSEFDEFGNVKRRRFFGLDGEPATIVDGYAGWRSVFDNRRNQREIQYLDVGGRPAFVPWDAANPERGGYSRIERKYTDRNLVAEEAYFGVGGERVLSDKGWSRAVFTYDDHGNQIATAYYCLTDEPCEIPDGYHMIQEQHDEQGKIIEGRFLNVTRQLVDSKNGYARWTQSYDVLGRLVSAKTFKADGKPDLSQGYHELRYTYDQWGHETRRAFAPNDVPAVSRQGYHAMNVRYDSRGNAVEWTYDDDKDRPQAGPNGCLKHGVEYDAGAHVLVDQCFDSQDQLSTGTRGYAIARYSYSPHGERESEAFFGKSGEKVVTAQGYHRGTMDHDDHGRETRNWYFGPDDKPTLEKQSACASIQTDYDPQGNLAAKACFGLHREPKRMKIGCHRISVEYNERRQPTKYVAFDESGRVIQTKTGVAHSERTYDGHGRLETETYYGTGGATDKDIRSRRGYRYDERSNQIEVDDFGSKGKFQMKTEKKFDTLGRVVRETYFGPGGAKLRLNGGMGEHAVEYQYDVWGNLSSQIYFDSDNKRCVGYSKQAKRMCYKWSAVYKGNRLIATSCDQDPSQPVVGAR